MRRRTTEEFIQDSKKIHGEKYDYTKVNYINQSTRVKLICLKHGEFFQQPKFHLKGSGCLPCGNERSGLNRKKDTKLFIEQAKKVFRGKYDYSKVNYTTSQSKVIIICPDHGEFSQVAGSHISGHGCRKCAFDKLSEKFGDDTETFISKAISVHGNKFDYSKVDYKRSLDYIIIICKVHGEFLQKPNGHLQGSGCIDCAGRRIKDTDQFIKEAKAVHDEKFDYSEVNYAHQLTKVKLICPKHGEFLQTPKEHLRGRGCRKCVYDKMSANRLKYFGVFLQEANEVHGNRYDYSKSKYIGGHKQINIVCKLHGEFEQTPKMHISGQGCPKCGLLKIGDLKRKTKQEFIIEASKIHEGKYDYTLVDYKNTDTKVIIICPIHGEIKQTPSQHLKSIGCNKCSIESRVVKRSSTTGEFISKARKVHGDRYDYKNVNYINQNIKVSIICRVHGEFFQTPVSHISGSGCIVCAGKNTKTLDEFLELAKEIHGDKYDYSKVNIINNNTNVIIICKEHGEFFQFPSSHLKGQGCRACSGSLKKTNEVFINDAEKIHGNKYDYSLVDYKTAHTNVIIICPEHGEFNQKPSTHLKGGNCSKCSYFETGLKQRTSLDEFISRSRKIHKEKYDYSLVNYEGNTVRVKIICPDHGVFEQQPVGHLSGHGCIQCSGLQKKTTEEFIEQAKEVHGDLYDYSEVNYDGTNKKIVIICNEHGSFEQIALSHTQGRGCPRCFLKHEGRLAIILNNLAIVHRQYSLENKRYDFYLPEYNLIIERDGEQHYRGVVWDGGNKQEAIKFVQENDLNKTNLAKKNGYDLCRIPYWLNPDEEFQEIINILEGNPSYPDVPNLKHEKTKPKPQPN